MSTTKFWFVNLRINNFPTATINFYVRLQMNKRHSIKKINLVEMFLFPVSKIHFLFIYGKTSIEYQPDKMYIYILFL